MKPLTLYIFIIYTITACSIPYSAGNAHAHNDYEHPVPFFTAFDAGFGSIEADVYVVNGVLHVAHNKEDIRAGRTLQALYLEPLLTSLKKDELRQVRLLIDIKDDHTRALPILLKNLEPLQPFLSHGAITNRLTILITGKRPPPADYAQYPDYIFFDDDLKLAHTPDEWKRVGLVSLPFNKISAWKGDGSISASDRRLLKHKIDSVHKAGKQIRFWAAPDTARSWKLQKRLHADLIGTDKIKALTEWLRANK
jgi:alkaline phosphatase